MVEFQIAVSARITRPKVGERFPCPKCRDGVIEDITVVRTGGGGFNGHCVCGQGFTATISGTVVPLDGRTISSALELPGPANDN